MNWQIKTRVWGRTVPHSGWRIRNNHINRIYYIHSGQVYVETNGKRVRLLPGHLYLLPEELPFVAWTRADDPMDHTYFDFDAIPCFLRQEIVDIGVEAHPVIQKWLELMQELFRAYQERCWEPEILEIVNACLGNLLLILSRTVEIPTTGDTRILDTLQYIQDHLDTPLSVELLAGRLFLDPHHFIRLFSRNIGQTPHKYIQNKRMSWAASLLQRGIPAKEVWAICGYGSYSAFARAFRGCYHCPPSQYPQLKNTPVGPEAQL